MKVDILLAAEVLGALGIIWGVTMGLTKFVNKITGMDKKLDSIMLEQYYLAKGTIASLKGLKEQGCNGPVTEALEELEEHISKSAHNVKE